MYSADPLLRTSQPRYKKDLDINMFMWLPNIFTMEFYKGIIISTQNCLVIKQFSYNTPPPTYVSMWSKMQYR